VRNPLLRPVAGRHFVWVRYGDWREQTERLQVRIEQPGSPPWTGQYGQRLPVDEDNQMRLYWGWAGTLLNPAGFSSPLRIGAMTSRSSKVR
jgi:hypothetical protein